MKLTRTWRAWWLLSVLPLMSGCAMPSPTTPGVTVRPPIRRYNQARQVPTPSACLPSCLERLTEWRKSTRQRLTAPE